MSIVPCEIFFDSTFNLHRDRNNRDRNKRDEIETFGIDMSTDNRGRRIQFIMKQVDTFCQRFNKFKNINCIDPSKQNNNIRSIKKLELNGYKYADFKKTEMQQMTKQLLFTFGSAYKSIYLYDVSLMIDTIQELSLIFHKNLEKLYINGVTTIDIDVNFNTNNESKCDDNNNYIDKKIGNLQEIEIDVQKRRGIMHAKSSLNCLDRFNMRRLVKHYILQWHPKEIIYTPRRRGPGVRATLAPRDEEDNYGIFNKTLFEDYDKHPLLEKITIQFKIKRDLSHFARLLLYFKKKYKNLFVKNKSHLKYFQKYEIHFDAKDSLGWSHVQLRKCKAINIGKATHKRIFTFKANEEYQVGKKMIVIKTIKAGIEQFV